MTSTIKYAPVSKSSGPGKNLATYKTRLEEYKKRKLLYLKKLSPMICLPSFLIRALQDYVANTQKFSQYEQIVINAWERAGLDQGKARAVLERLYTVPNINTHLDQNFLSYAVDSLDAKLVQSVAQVNWAKFLKDEIDPTRLQKAFVAGELTGLSDREKDFITSHGVTYYPASKEPDIAKVAEKTDWLLQKTVGKYVLCEKYKPARVYSSLKDLVGDVDKAASEAPPPPAKKVCAYDWEVSQLGHKIDSYSEAFGDDPVFIVNLFKRSDFAPTLETLLKKPHVYKPEDDEKHSNFRPCRKELYDPYNNYLGTERPIIVVSAFEDDQYFSDDTKAYIEFGLELASRIGSLDPTGIASIGVLALSVLWKIVCFIDWLDDDDYIGTTTYQFFPSLIPEGTNRNNPFTKVVDINLRKGDSIWRYRIELKSNGVVYV